MNPIIGIYKELNKLGTITDKLYCLAKYHFTVIGTFRAQNNVIILDKLSIHRLVRKFETKHFPDTKNNVEFTFWFLKFNAQEFFETIILNERLKRRLNSNNGKDEVDIELEKIKRAEGLARKLVIDNEIDTDLKYKDEKGYLYLIKPLDLPQPEYQTKEIRRVLNDYYESNPTEHSFTTIHSPEVRAYAYHVLFKNHLLEIINNSNKPINKNNCKNINVLKLEKENKKKASNELSMMQVALIYSYNGNHINYENMSKVASEYGYTSSTSGNRLMQLYNRVHSTTDRKGSQGSIRKDQNRINDIKKILPHLKSSSIKEKAEKEIQSLKNHTY